MRAARIGLGLAGLGLAPGCVGPALVPTPRTEPVHLLYSQDFDDPDDLGDFLFSDPAVWRWHPDGQLELTGRSDYAPPHRSPLSIALLAPYVFDDFVLEADLMQTGREYGHRDLCLFFAFEGPDRFHYVHLATTPDDRAHNVFLVDRAPRRALAEVPPVGVDWGTEVWHRVKLERSGAIIQVWFDAVELFELEDDTLGSGRIGFGSFDDQGRVDNVRIWGRRAAHVEGRTFPRQP